MENILTEEELKVARRLINISLAYSAEAFSKMINVGVKMETVEWHNGTLPDSFSLRCSGDCDNLSVLTTEVRGQLKGASFLVFTPEEAEAFWGVCLKGLPEAQLDTMRPAILMELDNILTASAVTRFSNFFNSRMYGDVPQLAQLTKEQAEKTITERTKEYDVVFSFKTIFQTEEKIIGTEFIWIFEKSFAEVVKKFTVSEETNNILEDHEDYIKKYFKGEIKK